MRILFILLTMLLVLGCTKSPIYTAGTCFEVDPFLIVSVDRVDQQYYYYTVNSFLTMKKRMKHKIFEKEMDKKGLIPKSCDELRD